MIKPKNAAGLFLALCLMGFSSALPAQTAAVTATAGGSGGTAFSDTDVPQDARILEVHVYSGRYVDAVQLQYSLADGRVVLGPRRGGPGGKLSIVRIDSDESITGISGRYGNYLDSIRIHTSKKTSPLIGGSGGQQDYSIQVPVNHRAIGFAGRSGRYLDALGLTYIPQTMSGVTITQIAGGTGGKSFADRDIPLNARLTKIRIRSANFVDSIQVIYTLPNGSIYEGPVHGGNGGRVTIFELEADEYITGVSGRYGSYIDSIVIHTNKRSSPAYGGRGGRRDFKIDVPAGHRGIGFVGRSAKYLDAIGLSSAPAPENIKRRDRRFRIGDRNRNPR